MNSPAVLTASVKAHNNNFGYLIWRLLQMKQQLIILAFFSLTSFPLLAIALDKSWFDDSASNNTRAILLIIAVFSEFCIFFITCMNALKSFNYLIKRSATDMIYSLPVSSRMRFWIDFATGIVPAIVCYAVSSAIGYFILNIVKNGNTHYPNLFGNMSGVLITLVGGLAALFMIYSFLVFCMSFCGRIFETVVFMVLIGVIIPAVAMICYGLVYGYVREIYISGTLMDLLAVSSPFGFIITTLYAIGDDASSYIAPIARTETLIPIILITALLVFASYYIIKRRKTEAVGKGLVYKPISYMVISAVIFSIFSFFAVLMKDSLSSDGNISGYVFAMILSSLIVFFLFDVIIKRGIKNMHIWFLRYIVTAETSLIITLLLISANGFGIGDLVPNADEVESFTTNFGMYEFDTNNYNLYGNKNKYLFEVTYSEPEYINLMLDVQQNCVKQDYDYPCTRINVTYNLKNGSKNSVYIFLSDNELMQLEQLFYSANYKNMVIDSLENYFYEMDFKHLNTYIYNYAYSSGAVNKNNFDELFGAFKKDYLAETYEKAKNPDTSSLAVVEFLASKDVDYDKLKSYSSSYSNNYYMINDDYVNVKFSYLITSNYTNLLAKLNEMNVTLPTLLQDIDEYNFNIVYGNKIILINDAIRDKNPKVEKILSKVTNRYPTSKNICTLQCISEGKNRAGVYYIPEELIPLVRELAEELQ